MGAQRGDAGACVVWGGRWARRGTPCGCPALESHSVSYAPSATVLYLIRTSRPTHQPTCLSSGSAMSSTPCSRLCLPPTTGAILHLRQVPPIPSTLPVPDFRTSPTWIFHHGREGRAFSPAAAAFPDHSYVPPPHRLRFANCGGRDGKARKAALSAGLKAPPFLQTSRDCSALVRNPG